MKGSHDAVTLVFALLLVSGLPQPSGAQEGAEPERPLDVHVAYTQFTLANGLNVLVHEDRTLPVVSVNVWYHVGSGSERPGRTGFAHLFEHLMFEGSANVPPGEFDRLLEGAGGDNNGSTTQDRTNYWTTVPSNALELALWLEADRMRSLLETIDREKLDLQRDVVMNERRQSYENRPYGLAEETILAALFPPGHPYHWPVIGSMEDLAAATLEDVHDFFRAWYGPENASIAVAGAVTEASVRRLVERHFGDIPRGGRGEAGQRASVPATPAPLPVERRLVLEDDVSLPRLYVTWRAPAAFSRDDAALRLLATVLAEGRSSRLHRTLVHEARVAQDVAAWQYGLRGGGWFQVVATARPGVPLASLEAEVRREIEALAEEGPLPGEMERAVNAFEAELVRSLEEVGGFGGKADRLNEYFFYTGNPGYLRSELAEHRGVTPSDVAAVARDFLRDRHAVVLSVVPRGATELAAERSGSMDVP